MRRMSIHKHSVAGVRSLHVALLSAFVAAGCSSSSSSGAGAPDASHDVALDGNFAAPNNCVMKGYMGNDFGIGAFCDDSTTCPLGGPKYLICTGSAGAPKTEYFCTTPCTQDSDCGMAAFCVSTAQGAGCVPTQCGGKPMQDAGAGDAAADVAVDAPADTSVE
jgi:hypothetical protein